MEQKYPKDEPVVFHRDLQRYAIHTDTFIDAVRMLYMTWYLTPEQTEQMISDAGRKVILIEDTKEPIEGVKHG